MDTGRRRDKKDRPTNVSTVKSESERLGSKRDRLRNNEQDRQCKHNVTMTRARAAIVAVEEQ
jgi:hypothetical protein